jgi:hypothetical protein
MSQDTLIVQELLRAEERMESNVERVTNAFESLNLKRSELLAAAAAGSGGIEKATSFDEESGSDGGYQSNPMSLRRQSFAAVNSVANILLRQATAAATTSTSTAATTTSTGGTINITATKGGTREKHTDGNGDDDSEWEELHDESSRKSYYWNRQSGETSWKMPAAFSKGKRKQPQKSLEAAASAENGDVELSPLRLPLPTTAVSFSAL